MSEEDEIPGIDQELVEDIRKAAEQVNAYFDELQGQSPRAAAVLAVASLENELGELLRGRFPGIAPKLWKQLAGPGFTPLGAFKARNLACHAFGFYGPQTKCTLERLAVIRNKFAHEIFVRGFDHPLVVQEFKHLASNPVHPFTWIEDMSAQGIRDTFVELCYQLEKALMDVRSKDLASHLVHDGRPWSPLP